MTRQEMLEDLALALVQGLKLENVRAGDITAETRLFGDDSDLGLDSLDAVELTVVLDKRYGVSFTNTENARQAFATLGTLADAILLMRTQA